jgi:phenylacetate-CoA ligase
MATDRAAATRAKWLETLTAHKRDPDAPGSKDYWSPSLDCASRDELVAIQNAKLAALAPFLYENSAFYRARFDRLAFFRRTSGPWTISPSGRSSTRPR